MYFWSICRVTGMSNLNCEARIDDCTEPALRKQAAVHCAELQDRFWETRAEAHRGMTDSRGHKLTGSCDNDTVPPDVKDIIAIICFRHSTESVRMYCLSCKKGLCRIMQDVFC